MAAIHVAGRMSDGWNYAATRPRPMAPDKLYRLSVWLRVDALGAETPAPFLKCEFTSAEGGRMLGQSHTEHYDTRRLGTWQRVVAEFRAPRETGAAWLAVEKGTDGPSEIDVWVADVRLESIARFSIFDTYRLDPVPPSLENARGIHPRLYLTDARIAELRQAIKTTHAGVWSKVRDQADRAVRSGPPAYRKHDSFSGDEQLWQRDVGNVLPVLAMAYRLTDDTRYLDSVRAWAAASCGYPTWGLGRIDGMDLAAGHQLYGLSLVYDWCYNDLGPAAAEQIRRTLVQRTSAMFEAAATGRAWWHRSYMQNHLWVNTCGMAAAGLALFDEVDDGLCWIGLPLDKFRRSLDALGPDGASHEGVGYWEYGVEYLLKFMELARANLDVDLYDHPWWRNTASYAQYLSLPRRAWTRGNCIVDIADCPRGHWYGPDYLLRRLAGQYRDGYAQWLADQTDDAGVTASGASWLNLLWLDPSVTPRAPADQPTARHFTDLGIVAARTGWDGDESLLVFKCGPFLGHEATAKFTYDPGGGHVHPDVNHFVLFGAGQWLIRDDGYRPKWTHLHNTLLVDDRGQVGEGREWFDGRAALKQPAQPRVLRAVSTPEFDQIVGDATAAYPPELGLKRFVRTLLFVKPAALIVLDDIAVERELPLELRFHPEDPSEQTGSAFVSQGEHAALRLELLTTDGVRATAERLPLPGRQGRSGGELFTIRLSTRRTEWRNAVALSWSPTDSKPTRITARSDSHGWTFQIGDRTLAWDANTGAYAVVSHRDDAGPHE